MISKKIANKVTKVSKDSKRINSQNDEEIPTGRYISLGERQEIIDKLRLI